MINKVTLIGNVGQDAAFLANEKSNRLSFGLATRSTYKNAKGENVEDTQWHDIVAWGALADYYKDRVTKGTQVYIEGSIRYWFPEDDARLKRTVIKVEMLRILTKSNNISKPEVVEQKTDSNESTQHESCLVSSNKLDGEGFDDLPF